MTFEQFSVDRGVLSYRQPRLSPWLRIFVAAFALCMLMLPAIAARLLTENPGIAEWAFVIFAFVFTGFFVAVLFREALAEATSPRN